ncbi:MAG: membrane protein insertase YidC [Pseudomonadota bacterium]
MSAMMDEQKRNLLLTVVFSIAILFGWQYFFPAPAPPQSEPQSEAGLPAQNQTPQAGQDTLTPALPVPSLSGDVIGIHRDTIIARTERVAIETPSLSGSISLTGARIDDLLLPNYQTTLDPDSPPIELFRPVGSTNPYYAEFGWAGDGTTLPDRSTIWQADAATLTPNQPVTLHWTNDDKVRFELQFTIDEDYMLNVVQRIVNQSARDVQLAAFGLISRTSHPDTLGFYILHEGPIGVLGGTLEELDYDDLQDQGTISIASQGGWLGITDKYWLSALAPSGSKQINTSFRGAERNGQPLYQVDFLYQPERIAQGSNAEWTSHLFAGAKETKLLDSYEAKYGIENFDLAVDFGWFYFLTKPIFYAIHWLNVQLGNFGLAILALTVLVKLLLFPLANKSYVSMSRMKLLQPQMMELKERYGDDRMKMQKEMMALYKREKINPAAGCLPILVQIPVFFALYKVLFVTIEMRHAPFFGWIHDLSAPDPLGILTIFGLIEWNVPALIAPINIGLWPLIMGLTMWLQMRLNPTPTDPIQAKIFMLMPILFTFLLGSFPAGLVIYWAWNNVLSMGQQWLIMRRIAAKAGQGGTIAVTSTKSAPESRSGIAEKMQHMLMGGKSDGRAKSKRAKGGRRGSNTSKKRKNKS